MTVRASAAANWSFLALGLAAVAVAVVVAGAAVVVAGAVAGAVAVAVAVAAIAVAFVDGTAAEAVGPCLDVAEVGQDAARMAMDALGSWAGIEDSRTFLGASAARVVHTWGVHADRDSAEKPPMLASSTGGCGRWAGTVVAAYVRTPSDLELLW